MILSCIIPALFSATTYDALVRTESGYNPYAIAVVRGTPIGRQPKTKAEAIAKIKMLEAEGANYSVGLGQINTVNFKAYNVTGESLLDPCTNLKVSQKILQACYKGSPNKKVTEALSCYYSGNYSYGFKKERKYGNTSYIQRIFRNHKNIGKKATKLTKEMKRLPIRVVAVRKTKPKLIKRKLIKNLGSKSSNKLIF